MTLFIDTWGWLALRDEKDPGFQAANRAFWDALDAGKQFYTTDYVLDETITSIYVNYGGIKGEQTLNDLLKTLKTSDVRVEEITRDRFQEALRLRRRYRDKPKISFTDLTTMVVMRELGVSEILTGDRHFEAVNLGFRLAPGG